LLARTQLPIGLGVTPIGGRHPAVLALELATLADIYPGRLSAGIGAGVPDLAGQIGAAVNAPVRAVGEALRALRALLAGSTLTAEGRTFTAREVALAHPPAAPPPLYLGVSGPKMLRLSATEADGTILSVLAGPEYVRWAWQQLRDGGASAGHRLVVYTLCAIDDDSGEARDALRELVAFAALPSPRNALSEVQGFAEEAEELSALDFDTATARIPDRWLDELTIAGTPAECTSKIVTMFDAGADSVVLCFPPGPDQHRMLACAGNEVLPQVRARRSDAKAGVR
jgi:alkanesulfonate monooxygenase SsuD/methylene tetrahydromethanopterin reductase-like flavin-dependent oxidoreductase (luciferase family)